MITLADLNEAAARIRGVAHRTPLVLVPSLARDASQRFYLKPENRQPIGAFKLRGAYNKIASLSPEQRKAGVITYSSGNHAQGVAYAAAALGVHAVIVMPGNAPAIKRAKTAALGAEIVTVGPASEERRLRAEELARQHGYIVVPPYDDEGIIAGQGTIGLEILEDLPDVDTVLAPVGGGGLLAGVATAIKLRATQMNRKVRVIGVEPEVVADAQQSFRSGQRVSISAEQTTHTLADGLRTQSLGELTFPHIQQYVDDIITVSEAEIREAMRRVAAATAEPPEPSGAVAVAGYLFGAVAWPADAKTVAIISGGNVDPEILAQILG